MIQRIFMAVLLICVCTFAVLADTVKLKDGTSIQGKVIDQGDKYWVKDNNGETHLIDKDSVLSWTRGSGGADAAGPAAGTATYSGSAGYAAVKTKADMVDTPIAAVGIWQAYIDGKPSAADLTAAKAELKRWQEMVDGDGEKINGKWVWGEDREKLLEKVRSLMQDGTQALESHQTILGIQKFEEAVKLYPNNFEANFFLGYYNLLKGVEAGRNNSKIEAGIKSMEMAVKLEDSKGTVQNLINTIAYAPPGMQNNSTIKPIMEEAVILAGKYGISPSGHADWDWVRPEEESPKSHKLKSDDEPKKEMAGIFACGTGFFISSNGYILTNRHVAKDGDYLMIRLPDNTYRIGERVVIDDEQDMAILKIKLNSDVPFVRLAAYDHPPVGADVAVFGFPVQFRFGLKASVKMTRGIVTAFDGDNKLCDVTVDAQVNPGNSGGPMIDRRGNLLALTAMKTGAQTGEVNISSYGLGYSNQRIRKFLKKQHAKIADANLADGKDDAPVLTNEELAQKLTPATVLILACNGTPPSLDSDGQLKKMPK
jgi:hypothetical protein